MPNAPVIRVLLADDHQIVRAGLMQFIDEQGDIKVVAEASSGDEAIALVRAHALDVVVLDISMPHKNGIDTLQVLHRTHPELPVLMLSGFAEKHYAVNLLRAGANHIRRRSTVFVVSDFISEPGWEHALGQLVLRHEVIAVRLTDPLELNLPDLGLVTLRDAETGEDLLVDTHDAGFRRRFAAIAAEREDALHAALARAGVDTLELSTEDDLANAVVRFAELRQQRTRSSSGGGMPQHLRSHARWRDNASTASPPRAEP